MRPVASNDDIESPPFEFRFRGIGPIEDAKMELAPLTIIAGRNNTGKTYLVYTLYGFLKTWRARPGFAYHLAHGPTGTPPMKLATLMADFMEQGEASLAIAPEVLAKERRSILRRLSQDFSEDTLGFIFSPADEVFSQGSFEATLGGTFFPSIRSINATSNDDSFHLSYDSGNLAISGRHAHRRKLNPVHAQYMASELLLSFLFPELPEPFILSAERFGISLFYKELDFTRNRLVELLQQIGGERDVRQLSPFLVLDNFAGRYALPIRNNIDYTRSIADVRRLKSELYEEKLFDGIKDLLGGYFKSSDDEIEFRSTARGARRFNIPLHLASSSARGLSDLYFFLRHTAQKNHLLIIDEPESHLDTSNQVLLARLLGRFVRAGIKVLVTTHSDYLIKEFNNLIMMNGLEDRRSSLAGQLGYQDDDFLGPELVHAYIAENNTLVKCNVDEFGLEMPVFDKTIDDINRVSSTLSSLLSAGEK